MEPMAIVMAFLAVFYIVFRGPLVVAPRAAIAFERRLYATTGRLRSFGWVILVLYAAPLILTARQAHTAPGDAAVWIERFGWFAAASAVWIIATPGPWKRFMDSFWDAVSDPPVLRAIGVLSVAFGLFLGWVAFFVL
ncbi:MAG: hypothetical protein AAEJ52_00820 [Myxococcota bacterium]